MSHGWFARFEDDAQPALCAVRDPYGVSLSVLGGGARAVPTPARKPTRRIARDSARDFPIELLSPSPELLWSCAWNAPASAPADVRLAARAPGIARRVPRRRPARGGRRRLRRGGRRRTDEEGESQNARRRARRGDACGTRVAVLRRRRYRGCDRTRVVRMRVRVEPPVALLATSRLVRSVDLRAKPSAGAFLAEPLAGDAPWRALAGPPVAEWSPSSFSFGGGRQEAFEGGGFLPNAFALACDRHVALYDLRKPNARRRSRGGRTARTRRRRGCASSRRRRGGTRFRHRRRRRHRHPPVHKQARSCSRATAARTATSWRSSARRCVRRRRRWTGR